MIVSKLAGGEPCSISGLTEGTTLTRQAVTKHLHVLESVGIVQSLKVGRESLFRFNEEPIAEAKSYLDYVSEQWDKKLSRLKEFVEHDQDPLRPRTDISME